MDFDDLDPEIQAEIAARQFESQEQDRFMWARSFAYRHMLSFFLVGMGMIGGGLALSFWAFRQTKTNGIDLNSTGNRAVWVSIMVILLGILVLMFSFARPDSKSILNAWLRVLGVLAILVILILIFIGLEQLLITLF